jgi:hypothetical protein
VERIVLGETVIGLSGGCDYKDQRSSKWPYVVKFVARWKDNDLIRCGNIAPHAPYNRLGRNI